MYLQMLCAILMPYSEEKARAENQWEEGKRRERKAGRDTNGSGKKGEVGRGRSRGV